MYLFVAEGCGTGPQAGRNNWFYRFGRPRRGQAGRSMAGSRTQIRVHRQKGSGRRSRPCAITVSICVAVSDPAQDTQVGRTRGLRVRPSATRAIRSDRWQAPGHKSECIDKRGIDVVQVHVRSQLVFVSRCQTRPGTRRWAEPVVLNVFRQNRGGWLGVSGPIDGWHQHTNTNGDRK